MAEPNVHIDELIFQSLQQSLTAEEETVLQDWIASSPANKTLFDQLTRAATVTPELERLYSYDEDRGWQFIKDNFHFKREAKLRPLWKKLAIAASIIGIIGIATYFIFHNEKTIVHGPSSVVVTSTDVPAPATNRARIKLADGTIVYLDSAANGELVNTNGVQVVKTDDGKIIYNDSRLPTADSRLVFNTLSNPRGSKVIDMTLADGSRVWLNVGSSVTYPVAFVGKERKVSITGEAYFEISHDKTKPFFVTKGDMQVQVLGTHFNVNAYDDEAEIKVTLLEGSVRVSTDDGRQSTVIKPSQQARVSMNGGLSIMDNVDLDAVMAWKNDLFLMDNTELATLLRQIGRWYDVEIRYTSLPDRKFGGGISRNLPLSKVLEMLAANGIHTKLENNVLTIQK
jgi:transmembrane sensor